MKRITTLIVALVLLTGAFGIVGAMPASAEMIEGPSLDIPVGTVVRGDAGSSHELGTVTVPEELRGMVCTVHATATNQDSVHPNSDIVVSSDGTSVTLYNVEREGFVTTPADDNLELGDTLSATLIMGEDEVFSGGIVVTTTCTPPPPDPEDQVEVSCDPATGLTEVVQANVGEVSFTGLIENGDGTGVSEKLEPGESISFNFNAGEAWYVSVNGIEHSSGVAESCLMVTTTTAPPETTTTTAPPETTSTTAPPETTTTVAPPTTLPFTGIDAAAAGKAGAALLLLGSLLLLASRREEEAAD